MLLQLFILSRPLNVLIAAMSILIAAAISIQFSFSSAVILAILSTACITAAANIINDIIDLDIDSINRPDRILPSQKVTVKTAWITYYLLNVLGLFLALNASFNMFLIALFAILLLYSYSAVFKKKILIGNLIVSFLTALAFIYGAIAVGDISAGFIPALFSFLFHFGREIIKDMQDVQGDLTYNAVTFAGHFGKKVSIIFINIIFIILIGCLFLPYVLKLYNIYYIYIVMPGVALVLLFVSTVLWFKSNDIWLSRISIILKADMFIGLAALYIGGRNDFFINN